MKRVIKGCFMRSNVVKARQFKVSNQQQQPPKFEIVSKL